MRNRNHSKKNSTVHKPPLHPSKPLNKQTIKNNHTSNSTTPINHPHNKRSLHTQNSLNTSNTTTNISLQSHSISTIDLTQNSNFENIFILHNNTPIIDTLSIHTHQGNSSRRSNTVSQSTVYNHSFNPSHNKKDTKIRPNFNKQQPTHNFVSFIQSSLISQYFNMQNGANNDHNGHQLNKNDNRAIRPLSFYTHNLLPLQQQQQHRHKQKIATQNLSVEGVNANTDDGKNFHGQNGTSITPSMSPLSNSRSRSLSHDNGHTFNHKRNLLTQPKRKFSTENGNIYDDSSANIDVTQLSSDDIVENVDKILQNGDQINDEIDETSSNLTPRKHRHYPKQRKKVIIITGGTAVGKTSLSIELARKLNGEIISADSMQIYSHFDTGTAKIGLDETDGIPHHLVDIVPSGGTDFSSSMFYSSATEIINNVVSRQKTPILVGGTGLYLRWLLYGRPQGMNITPDQSSRTVCINHYMGLLTRGLIGWEKSVGAGKGVGKTQQVTHTENLYKFHPPTMIPSIDDVVRSKTEELQQVVELYPLSFFKEKYNQNDIKRELLHDELQHICISNQIRWVKLNQDVVDSDNNNDYGKRFVKVDGVRKVGLQNYHTMIPEFQSVPFLDTLHELYDMYCNNNGGISDEEMQILTIIRGLFLEPESNTFPQQDTSTRQHNQQNKTSNNNTYMVFQNDHPFPLSYDQNKQLIGNAQFSAHFYRLYALIHFIAYNKNVASVIRNLFVPNDENTQNNDDNDMFSFLYDQPESIDTGYDLNKHKIPVVKTEHGYFTPRLLYYQQNTISEQQNNSDQTEQTDQFTSKTTKDSTKTTSTTIENQNTNPIEQIQLEMSAILDYFGTNDDNQTTKLPKKLILDYITLLLTNLDQQYHNLSSYRRFLHTAQCDYIQKYLETGESVVNLIFGDDFIDSLTLENNNQSLKQYHLQQLHEDLQNQHENDKFIQGDGDNDSKNTQNDHHDSPDLTGKASYIHTSLEAQLNKHQSLIQTTEDSLRQQLNQKLLLSEDLLVRNSPSSTPSSPNSTDSPQESQQSHEINPFLDLKIPQTRRALQSYLTKQAFIDKITPLQNEQNLFSLTLESINNKRSRLIQEIPELTQTIDHYLEDPLQLRQKYHDFADYRHLWSTAASCTTASNNNNNSSTANSGNNNTVDSFISMFYLGFEDPHSLSPITSVEQLNEPLGKSQLQQYTKKNQNMIETSINYIRNGVAKRLPLKTQGTLTTNIVYTIVPNRGDGTIIDNTNTNFINNDNDDNNDTISLSQHQSLPSGLEPGLYKCPNDIYIRVQYDKPNIQPKQPPTTPIHPFNSLLFQSRLLFSRYTLPAISWVESHRYCNDLYRLEKSLSHVLATNGVAIPPKYKDQMNTQPLERLAGRIPWDDDEIDLENQHDQPYSSRALYNPSTANTEGLINHYDVRCYFLHTHRNLHYRLADFRCEQMVRGGMLKETLLLLNTYNDNNAVIPYPIIGSDSNTGTVSMNNPNDGGIRGLWPTSRNFDYFMRNDVDGYLKRYFPHPQHDEATLMLTDTTVVDHNSGMGNNNNNNNKSNNNSNDETNSLVAKDQEKLHLQQLTSEWAYLDELMFTYRQVALPYMSQIFDITHTLIVEGLKGIDSNKVNQKNSSKTTDANNNTVTPFVLYHNQYKHQFLDPNSHGTSSSDVYNSNALTTLTYSIFERSLTYLGHLLEFPQKIDQMFAHCNFTKHELQHLEMILNNAIRSQIIDSSLEDKGKVTDVVVSNVNHYDNDLVKTETKKSNKNLDPRVVLIALAVNCMQIERQMVVYAPIQQTVDDGKTFIEEIDSTHLQDLLQPMLKYVFGDDYIELSDNFGHKLMNGDAENNSDDKIDNNIMFNKVKTLLNTAGISLDYSTRRELLEYDFSITDSYKAQRSKQTIKNVTNAEEKTEGKDLQDKDQDNSDLIERQPPTTSQHLYNYEIYNDNTSPLHRFVTGRSGQGFVNETIVKDSDDERLTDTIIKKNPKTRFTILPCEHLITLPKIRLIQHTLPDEPYLVNDGLNKTLSGIAHNEASDVVTALKSNDINNVNKPVNINPLANTVVSLFSPRVKSIGYTNILGFFTDSSISTLFTQWNDLMAKKELERDLKYDEVVQKYKKKRLEKMNKKVVVETKSEIADIIEEVPELTPNSTEASVENINSNGGSDDSSLVKPEETFVKKVKIPAVITLSVDGEGDVMASDTNDPNGDDDVKVWKPKVYISTSKDKSHHFIPTIGVAADITHPNGTKGPDNTAQITKILTNQQKKGKKQQQNSNSANKESASARLPWNTNVKVKEDLLNNVFPINTNFVDGVRDIQNEHFGIIKNKPNNNVHQDQDGLINFTSLDDIDNDDFSLPPKPPVQLSIADLRSIITPTFVNQFTSLLNDFQTSTRGYIKRQHTFFQDEPLCQLVTIPFENIPMFMHNNDHVTFRTYQDSVQKYLKSVGMDYDQILHEQYETMKSNYDQQQSELKRLQQQENEVNDSDGSDSSSSSSSRSSTLSSTSLSTSDHMSTTSYPFSFPKSINFNLMPKHKFTVKDVQFNNIHVGAYYKEFMYRYIPQHVRNSMIEMQIEHDQNNNNNNNDNFDVVSSHSSFIFDPNSQASANFVENTSKHPLRRAMPVVYDFSNTKYSLLTPLSASVAPLLKDNSTKSSLSDKDAPNQSNNTSQHSTLGLYKQNLQRVIGEITHEITNTTQIDYWTKMLNKHHHRHNTLAPSVQNVSVTNGIDSDNQSLSSIISENQQNNTDNNNNNHLLRYPYTTLSTIPPLMDSCIDLTSYQGQLQLYWNDGIVVESIIDLFEFQRGLSLIISSSQNEKKIQDQNKSSFLDTKNKNKNKDDTPLDVKLFNYFSHHKTILQQDMMSTRLFNHNDNFFITDNDNTIKKPHQTTNDSNSNTMATQGLSLSSPINNSNNDTNATTATTTTMTNVQSVRQYGIDSNNSNTTLGQRITYPWNNFVQLDNNELLATKHAY